MSTETKLAPYFSPPAYGSSPISRLNTDVLYLIFNHLAALEAPKAPESTQIGSRHMLSALFNLATSTPIPSYRSSILLVCKSWFPAAQLALRRHLNLTADGVRSEKTKLGSWIRESEVLRAQGRDVRVNELKLLKVDTVAVFPEMANDGSEGLKKLVDTVDSVENLHLVYYDCKTAPVPAFESTSSLQITHLFTDPNPAAPSFPNLKRLRITNNYSKHTSSLLPLFTPDLTTLALSPTCSLQNLPLTYIHSLTCDASGAHFIDPDTPLAVEDLTLRVNHGREIEKWMKLIDETKALKKLRKVVILPLKAGLSIEDEFEELKKVATKNKVECSLWC